MKRILSFIMALAFIFCLASCGKKDKTSEETSETETESVTENPALQLLTETERGYLDTAVETIEAKWQNLYENYAKSADGYFNIVNTRLIRIKDNEEQRYSDLTAIVEFVIYSDYYAEHPYYFNCNMCDTVMFHKDGTPEAIGADPLMYDFDRNDDDIELWHRVVGEIIDLGDVCNTNRQGAVKPASEQDEMMKTAVEAIKKSWSEYLDENGDADRNITIVNSRIIKISENNTDEFGNVSYIAEFDIYADYYGSGNYPVNQYAESCNVVFHTDGTYSVDSGYINKCRTGGSFSSLSGLIESITEFGTYYNTAVKV